MSPAGLSCASRVASHRAEPVVDDYALDDQIRLGQHRPIALFGDQLGDRSLVARLSCATSR